MRLYFMCMSVLSYYYTSLFISGENQLKISNNNQFEMACFLFLFSFYHFFSKYIGQSKK